MNRIFLYSAALITMLGSCTKEDNNVNIDSNELVPIQIGAGNQISTDVQASSRASRAPLDEWAETTVGLFALAKNATAWNIDDPRTNPSVLWNDVRGTITGAAETTVDVTVDFDTNDDGTDDIERYYPKAGTMNYSFYGYYPTEAVTPVLATNNVTATCNIDGSHDLIYGNAVAEQLAGSFDGYNAVYFRISGAKTPNIQFKHLLTQLKFRFKRETGFDEGQTIKVKNIVIENQPETLNLLIASLEDGQTPGTLTANGGNTKEISSNLTEAIEINSATYTDTPEEIVSPLMLFTQGVATSVYKGYVELEGNTPGSSTLAPITINAPDGKGFEVGKAYTVSLTISDMKEIEVQATLSKWVEGAEIDGGTI